MLKRVIITNSFGESMEYVIDGVQAENPSGLIITSIDGLGPVKANINMVDLATNDGSKYNSARLSSRNIVIKAIFTHASSIEEARLLSYKYFPIKSKVHISIETDNRVADTDGYVESNEPDIFSKQSGCQISIICENPYFDGGEVNYLFGDTIPLFKFAFGNGSLDQRLIKISEDTTPTAGREFIYGGDVEAGIEMNINLLTDNILDGFSVTELTVTQDDDKRMDFLLHNMETLVPNSSPTDLDHWACSFIMDDDRCKFIPNMPEPVRYAYPVTYQNELHCFYENATDNILHHMKLNKETLMWEKLEDTTCAVDTNVTWIVCLNDVIYRYYWYTHTIYRFDESTNYWAAVLSNISDDAVDSYGHLAVAYKNAIHCFSVTSSGINRHYIFNGSTYQIASDSGTMQTVLTRNDPDYLFGGNREPYSDAMALVYDNKIHILGGISGGVDRSDRHFTFDGTTWTELTNARLPGDSNCRKHKTMVVYHNRIHYFERYIGTHALRVYHNSWDAQTGWRTEVDTPFDFGSQSNTHVIADSDYMYFVGLDEAGSYTEEPNNTMLIAGDQLIINTNKGKKSITLIRGGNKYNVLNILDKNPTWFKLKRGANRFSYSAVGSEDALNLIITANKWYEGV